MAAEVEGDFYRVTVECAFVAAVLIIGRLGLIEFHEAFLLMPSTPSIIG